MDMYITFIEDVGVRFPPGNLRDPLIDHMRGALASLSFPDFERLGIYMHLPGKHDTFGMPSGVTLRLNRKKSALEARCVLDGEKYRQLKNWEQRLSGCVDGVIQTLQAVLKRYKREDELPIYQAELEALKPAPEVSIR